MADWSPSLYARFEDERTRPARDLVAQVPLSAAHSIVDMGCGPGNSTELLVERWPGAKTTGLDSSPAMLEEARKRLPQATFGLADAASWLPPADTDLVFANAIYQWVPDHLDVLPKVLEVMREGACLAVQMPDNLAEPTHRLMRDVAANGPWADKLKDAARLPLPAAHVYYDALKPFARRIDIWHSIYNHVLADAAAIVGEVIVKMFAAGSFVVATLFFSRFRSVISQVPTAAQLIPAKAPEGVKPPDLKGAVYEYEPNETEILEALLPRYLNGQLLQALLENQAGFYGAQMSAMDSATRNAGDLIKKLTLRYNRQRQANITKELIEIISGAEAL